MEIIDEKTENDEGIDSFDSFTEENDEESKGDGGYVKEED